VNRGGCSRRPGPPADPPFFAEEMWSLCDNPDLRWFCESAFLVDEYESLSLSGSPCLAFATHLPSMLETLETATSLAVHADVLVRFAALEAASSTSDSLWRCDVAWSGYPRRRFAVAGAYDDELLGELREASLLLLIDASIWEWWEPTDVHLAVPNDQELWSRCEA
jgi:hypothetical protein